MFQPWLPAIFWIVGGRCMPSLPWKMVSFSMWVIAEGCQQCFEWDVEMLMLKKNS